jgi:hypothetical protein
LSNVPFIQEQSVDLVSQRVQMNSQRAINALKKDIDAGPSLIFEEVEGILKTYTNQEYEVYHGLGRECSAISVAISDGLVIVYAVQDSNPSNLDRKNYVRIKVSPIVISGVNYTEASSPRKIKFWVA